MLINKHQSFAASQHERLLDSFDHIVQFAVFLAKALINQFFRIGAKGFNIKPIFHLSGGRIKLIGAARTRQSGMQKLLAIMRRRGVDKPPRVFVAHAGDPEGGEQLKALVAANCDCGEIWLSDFSPVMGYATGRGTLMLAYCDNGG